MKIFIDKLTHNPRSTSIMKVIMFLKNYLNIPLRENFSSLLLSVDLFHLCSAAASTTINTLFFSFLHTPQLQQQQPASLALNSMQLLFQFQLWASSE